MEQNMEKKFLEIKDLRVEYTSEGKIIHAVNGVSLKLEKGHSLGLVGETGAGKTTIAKSIMRILNPVASHVRGGEIYLNGVDVLKVPEAEMRQIRSKVVAMIFQDPMTALNPVRTVGDQIAEVIKIHNNVSVAKSWTMAEDMLERVGILRERASEYPHQFSGGMKQRVVIAIALACNPELLLADEPTTALDVTIQAQVLEMINQLKVEFNSSLLLITHDLGIVAETCDEVAVIYAGKIVENGPIESVFNRPSHPYTVGLFGALPRLDEEVDRLSPIAGMPPDPTNLPEGGSFHPRCPRATEQCRQKDPQMREIAAGHFCACHNV